MLVSPVQGSCWEERETGREREAGRERGERTARGASQAQDPSFDILNRLVLPSQHSGREREDEGREERQRHGQTDREREGEIICV